MTEHQNKQDHNQVSARASEPQPLQGEELASPETIHQSIVNPTHATLTPKVVQALQRTYGNQYTQRLVNRARSNQDRLAPLAAEKLTRKQVDAEHQAIQRLIGFEIETGIPATKQTGDDPKVNTSYTDPKKGEFGAKMEDGSDLDIDANPSGGGRILEFGSVAVDETQDVESFKKQAATWLDLLTTLRANALKAELPLPLTDVLSNAAKNARYGKTNATQKQDAMERISIQVTHAMRLDKVRQFLAGMNLHDPAGSQKRNMEQAAHEASPTITTTMNAIKEDFPPEKIIEDEAKRATAVEELEGFFTLISHYLLIFKYNLSDQGKGYKHRTSLMYKTKLSDVRNKLIVRNAYAAPILGGGEVLRNLIISGLLADTGRMGSDDLFSKRNLKNRGDPSIIDWLTAILSGTGDPGYDAARSSPGGPLPTEDVEGALGAVVEHRYIHLELPPETAWKMSDPKGLLTYLAIVYEANQAWQGVKAKKVDKGVEGDK